MLHNYTFRPLFKAVFRLYTLSLVSNVVYLSSGYITLKAKRIQPEDGLKKGPKRVVV